MEQNTCLLMFVMILATGLPTLNAAANSQFNNTNCSVLSHVLTGVKALSVYTAKFYNTQDPLENPSNPYFIATNLFEPGLQLMAVAGIYSHLLLELQKQDDLHNYPGFGNLNYLGFFGTILSTLMKDTCEWLMTHGDALTIRPNVNCSNPAELMMLSQFSFVTPIMNRFIRDFMWRFDCSSYEFDEWMNINIRNEFQQEMDYLNNITTHALAY